MKAETGTETDKDSYLDVMKTARSSSAVLKYKLVGLRALIPGAVILAFEGDDDKLIYSQWIRRVRPDLDYEPFPCGGKKYVLELFEIVQNDRGDLGDDIYFVVDRDFDADVDAQSQKIFVTDAYSSENYLVSERVLVELLKNEFHCHGKPSIRDPICHSSSVYMEAFWTQQKSITKEYLLPGGVNCASNLCPTKLLSLLLLRSIQ